MNLVSAPSGVLSDVLVGAGAALSSRCSSPHDDTHQSNNGNDRYHRATIHRYPPAFSSFDSTLLLKGFPVPFGPSDTRRGEPACQTRLMGTNQRSQIVMSDDEITDFISRSRTGTLATIGPDGQAEAGSCPSVGRKGAIRRHRADAVRS